MEAKQTSQLAIGRREFEDFRRLIHDVSGIALGDNKDALLAARVARRMRALQMTDHADYLDHVLADRSGDELRLLIDAVSTNVTSFFREPAHFDALAQRLREVAARGTTEIRLWSAACSSGEEPYSMAMVAADALADCPVRVRILATDINGEILDRARAGRYAPERVAQVPREYAARYLRKAPGGQLEVVPQLKSMISFTRINLSAPPFPMRGPFEAIMCRNVMIYFGKPTRQALVTEMERLVSPGGLLMLGHAESLAGIDTGLRPIAPAVYRRLEA